MQIVKNAVSGTLESCDAMVYVEPCDGGLEIEIESVVLNRYGEHILSVVRQTLEHLDVRNAHVRVQDRGALDCTLCARVQSAVVRAGALDGKIPWEAMKWPM